LDGKYVIESTVSKEEMTTKQLKEKYKRVAKCRTCFKTNKLNIRIDFSCK